MGGQKGRRGTYTTQAHSFVIPLIFCFYLFGLFIYLSFYRCYLGGRRDVAARTTQTYSNELLRGSSMKRFLYVSLFSDLFPSFYFLFSFLRAFARFLNEKGLGAGGGERVQ